MHRQLLVLVAAFAVATLAAGSAFAQGPLETAFTCQGRLEESGVPATGAFDFSFVLYDAPTGGAALGIDCLDGVPVSRGLFSVEIDFGSSPFGGARRWMEIYVRPDGADACDENVGTYTLLDPRRELTPAPHARYSIEAGVARSATSLSAPDGDPSPAVYVDDEGRVGIGTTTPAQALAIGGAQSPIRAVTLSASIASTPRLLPTAASSLGGGEPWQSPANALADDGAFASVGLNISQDSEFLDLTGFGFALPLDAQILGIELFLDGTADGMDFGVPIDSDIQLLGGSAESENKARGALFSSQTYGGARDLWGLSWTREQINSPGFGARVRASYPSSFPSFFSAYVDHVAITVYYYGEDSPSSAWTFGVNDDAFALARADNLDSPMVRVDASGNVGIGTSTPANPLHVARKGGAATALANGIHMGVDANDNAHLDLVANAMTPYIDFSNDNFVDFDFRLILRNNDALELTGGNVGINNPSPGFPLHVGADATNGNGAHVTAGGAWTNGSSREFKEGFAALDPVAILETLVALPITKWRYKQSEEGEHIGPVAEEFRAAFGLGHDDRYIATVDADGVALAAIQGLNAKLRSELDAKQAELDAQQARIEELEAGDRALLDELRAMRERLEALEARTAE